MVKFTGFVKYLREKNSEMGNRFKLNPALDFRPKLACALKVLDRIYGIPRYYLFSCRLSGKLFKTSIVAQQVGHQRSFQQTRTYFKWLIIK